MDLNVAAINNRYFSLSSIAVPSKPAIISASTTDSYAASDIDP